MVRLGPPLVPYSLQRLIAGKALNADLSRDIILGYLTGGTMGSGAERRRRKCGDAKEQESRQTSTHHHRPQSPTQNLPRTILHRKRPAKLCKNAPLSQRRIERLVILLLEA